HRADRRRPRQPGAVWVLERLEGAGAYRGAAVAGGARVRTRADRDGGLAPGAPRRTAARADRLEGNGRRDTGRRARALGARSARRASGAWPGGGGSVRWS